MITVISVKQRDSFNQFLPDLIVHQYILRLEQGILYGLFRIDCF